MRSTALRRAGLACLSLLGLPRLAIATTAMQPATNLDYVVTTVDLETTIGDAFITGLFNDGTYGYLITQAETNDQTVSVVRFNLATLDGFTSLDTSTTPIDFDTVSSGFVHGGYGYVLPWIGGGGAYVSRFSTANFDSHEKIQLSSGDVAGGFHDGTWCYLPPAEAFRYFVRFSFADWSVEEAVDLGGAAVYGNGDGLYTPRSGFVDTVNGYAYLVPFGVRSSSAASYPDADSVLIRVNTATGMFTTAETWDLAGVTGQTNLAGYSGGIVHGTYAYLIPNVQTFDTTYVWHGQLTRFSLQHWNDNSQVEVFDFADSDQFFKGFHRAWSAGSFGYMITQHDDWNNQMLVRFNLDDPTSVQEQALAHHLAGESGAFKEGMNVDSCTFLVGEGYTSGAGHRTMLQICPPAADTTAEPTTQVTTAFTTEESSTAAPVNSPSMSPTTVLATTDLPTTDEPTTLDPSTTLPASTTTVPPTTASTEPPTTEPPSTVAASTGEAAGSTVEGSTTADAATAPPSSAASSAGAVTSGEPTGQTSAAPATAAPPGTTEAAATTAAAAAQPTTPQAGSTATTAAEGSAAQTTAGAATSTAAPAASTAQGAPGSTAPERAAATSEQAMTSATSKGHETTEVGTSTSIGGPATTGDARASASSSTPVEARVEPGTSSPGGTTTAGAGDSRTGGQSSRATAASTTSTGKFTTPSKAPRGVPGSQSTTNTVPADGSSSPTTTSSQSTTTSTRTVPDVLSAAMGLLGTDGAFSGSLVADLRASGANVTTTALPYGGTILAHRVNRAFAVADSQGELFQSIDVPKSDVQVQVPLSTLAHLGVEDDVAMVVTVFDAGNPDFKGLSGKKDVAGAVVMNFRTLRQNEQLDVTGLPQPIKFTLPVNYSAGMTCMYWDETAGDWSLKGVATASQNVEGQPLGCETTHLSLFGAILEGIVNTLACANVFGLMNVDAFRAIFEGQWYAGRGALIFAFVLVMLAVSIVLGVCLDKKRKVDFDWKDEFFLVVVDPPAERRQASDESLDETAALAAGNKRKGCCAVLCGCTCCASLQEHTSSVLKEALDDIASSWFEYFAEFRTLFEEFLGCLSSEDAAAAGTGVAAGRFGSRFCAITHRATASMMLFTSRRSTAASLGLSEEIIRFVLEDQDLVEFLMEELLKERLAERTREREGMEMGLRPSTRSSTRGAWRTSPDQRDAWNHLRSEITDHLFAQTRSQGERPQFLKTVFMIFACQNPLGSLFVIDIFRTCKQRVVLLAVELLGSFAFCCVFFESSGIVKGKRSMEGCNDDDGGGVGQSIGRFIVISLSSLIIAGLPVAVLNSLQTKKFTKMPCVRGSEAWNRQLRKWVIQERIYWIFGSFYMSICVLYIVLFLSNIGDDDHEDWSFAGILALLQDLLMLPLMTAFMVPLITKVLLCAHVSLTTTRQEQFVRHATLTLQRRIMMPVEAV